MNTASKRNIKRLIKRVIIASVAVVAIYTTILVVNFYVKFRSDVYEANVPVKPFPEITADCRFLIIVPHSDDETIACGGLIQQALKAGADVQIIIVTNGDGFRQSAAWESKSLKLSPNDYLALTDVRRLETISAVNVLGLKEENIHFLGYPDSGLMPMWKQYWLENYTSKFTKKAFNKSIFTYKEKVFYRGQDLMADLADIIRRFKPTDIIVPHPIEDHSDHSACAWFVGAALIKLKFNGLSYTDNIRLYAYMIHRGDWPIPQGYHPGKRLSPPECFDDCVDEYFSLELDKNEIAKKKSAVDKYESQKVVLGRFMSSFVRQNEIFFRQILINPNVQLTGDPYTKETWDSANSKVVNPSDDNFLRHAKPSIDIKSFAASVQNGRLHARIEMKGKAGAYGECNLFVRGFMFNIQSSDIISVRCKSGKTDAQDKAIVRRKDNVWFISVPLGYLSKADAYAVWAETKLTGVVSDRTSAYFIYSHSKK